MIFAALTEAADRGELLLVESGLCRFHRRRDGIVVIRELLVLPTHRRKGLGRKLVEEVIGRAFGHIVQAKCPARYESNAFWLAIGFVCLSQKEGINLWQRPVRHG